MSDYIIWLPTDHLSTARPVGGRDRLLDSRMRPRAVHHDMWARVGGPSTPNTAAVAPLGMASGSRYLSTSNAVTDKVTSSSTAPGISEKIRVG